MTISLLRSFGHWLRKNLLLGSVMDSKGGVSVDIAFSDSAKRSTVSSDFIVLGSTLNSDLLVWGVAKSCSRS